MEAWIPVTLAAALAQTLRFAVQRHLRATRLSTGGATFSRFVFAAPVLGALLAAYALATGQSVSGFGPVFWAFAATGGLAQVMATMCVVALFGLRAFAVGITLKNTETVQAAILGLLILGETIRPGAVAAIALGFVGTALLTDPPVAGRRSYRAAALGLAAGALFAVSAVMYRGAVLELSGGPVAFRAGLTLFSVMALQAAGLGLWLGWREPGQIGAVLGAWRLAALAGGLSLIGSFCWFTAFALAKVAYVKALGQVELLLSLAVSMLFLGERITWREAGGIALLAASILWLLAAL